MKGKHPVFPDKADWSPPPEEGAVPKVMPVSYVPMGTPVARSR
jgi:hypothetical protein